MANGVFFIRGKFGKGFIERGIKKYGIIPESARSFFLMGDKSMGVFLDFCDDFSSTGQNHARNISSIPVFLRDSFQELENFLNIVLIGCVWSGKPGRINSRGTLEIVDLES